MPSIYFSELFFIKRSFKTSFSIFIWIKKPIGAIIFQPHWRKSDIFVLVKSELSFTNILLLLINIVPPHPKNIYHLNDKIFFIIMKKKKFIYQLLSKTTKNDFLVHFLIEILNQSNLKLFQFLTAFQFHHKCVSILHLYYLKLLLMV